MAHLHLIIALPWTTLFALKIRNNMATLVVLLVEGTWVASFLKGYHFWHSHIKPSLNDAAFCVLTSPAWEWKKYVGTEEEGEGEAQDLVYQARLPCEILQWLSDGASGCASPNEEAE